LLLLAGNANRDFIFVKAALEGMFTVLRHVRKSVIVLAKELHEKNMHLHLKENWTMLIGIKNIAKKLNKIT
jgi:hypothetical protein